MTKIISIFIISFFCYLCFIVNDDNFNSGQSDQKRDFSSEWAVLTNCSVSDLRYEPDGDSFEVKFNGGTEVFRLWGVDCPETSAKTQQMKDRVMQQSYDFRKSFDQTIWWGKIAKNFTLSKLKEGFIVETRWQKCFGYRYYCKVKLSTGEDLGDLLLKKGYARAMAGHLPFVEQQRLEVLEKEAKDKKIGIWAKQ